MNRDQSAAARLKANKDRVLGRWKEAVCRDVPAAPGQSTPAIIDNMPEVIDRLVETLAAESPQEVLKRHERDLAHDHGEERARLPDYTLDQMIWEYQLLRRVLFEILEEDEPLRPRDRDAIWDALFIAVRNSSACFSAVREEVSQKLHIRKVRETEERHLLLVDSIRDYALFTINPSGIIMTWTQGCVRMKQYTPDEAIGRHFEMLYPEDGRRRNEPMDHLKTALVEGRFRGEGMRLKKDGTLFLADVTIVPLHSEGRHIGFGKIVGDLDERSRLIQERDLSRTEAETLKMEKALRERFVSALTHDLRTPLTAARMGAQLVAMKPEDPQSNGKLAGRILDNLDRMDAMIRDLLDAGRIRAGERIALQMEECDLAAIAARVREDFATIFGDRFRLERTTPLIGWWSPDAMRRILENLLSNAEKYSEPGTPITITFQEVEDRVFIVVHNFGRAIAPEDLPSLFDQFRRTKEAERGSVGGWGLGLTLVRGLTEAQGGMVKVESYPREGTRFTVDVPRDARRHDRRSMTD
jgi:PAS domain S-box-containing protein